MEYFLHGQWPNGFTTQKNGVHIAILNNLHGYLPIQTNSDRF